MPKGYRLLSHQKKLQKKQKRTEGSAQISCSSCVPSAKAIILMRVCVCVPVFRQQCEEKRHIDMLITNGIENGMMVIFDSELS